MPTQDVQIRTQLLAGLAALTGKKVSAALLRLALDSDAMRKVALRLIAGLIRRGVIAGDPALVLGVKGGAFATFGDLAVELERRALQAEAIRHVAMAADEAPVAAGEIEPTPPSGVRITARRRLGAVKKARGPVGLKPKSPAPKSAATTRSLARPAAPPEGKLATRTVFFATDRAPLASSKPNRLRFAADRSKEGLILGRCEVTFPPKHKLGKLERPLKILGFEFKEDPQKHVVLKSVTRLDPDDFYAEAKAHVGKSKRREAFVFVHGFNVKFDAAALKTAQMAHDLRFDGAAILYSWPSIGSPDPRSYITDSTNATWTEDHFTAFLTDLANRLGAERINVIAHSMGNRVVCNSLKDITSAPAAKPKLHHMVLAAPDVDADTFLKRVKVFMPITASVTLYASSQDKAIAISRVLNTEPRAGEPIVLHQGMTSVDASDVDTDFIAHGYFSDSRWVLNDIRNLFDDKPPGDRFDLRPAKNTDGDYFRFRV